MGTFFHARKPEILRKPGSVRIFGEAHGTLQKTPIIFSTKKKQHNSHWATLQLCTWLIPPAHSPCVGVEMRISRHCSAVVTGSPETSWLSLGWQPSLASLFPAVCTQWFAPIVLFAVAKKRKINKISSPFKVDSYFCHENIESVKFQIYSRICITLLISTTNLKNILSTLIFLTSTEAFSSN